jgi:hypothetical protein
VHFHNKLSLPRRQINIDFLQFSTNFPPPTPNNTENWLLLHISTICWIKLIKHKSQIKILNVYYCGSGMLIYDRIIHKRCSKFLWSAQHHLKFPSTIDFLAREFVFMSFQNSNIKNSPREKRFSPFENRAKAIRENICEEASSWRPWSRDETWIALRLKIQISTIES